MKSNTTLVDNKYPDSQPSADHTDESRWSFVPTSSLAIVLSILSSEADRVEKPIPRSRRGRQWTYADEDAKERFEGAWSVLDDLKDEVVYELELRRNGAAA